MEELPKAHLEWVHLHLKELFDLEVEFPAFYSNRNLAPWQGAASWFEGDRLVYVQLRTALKKGSYLGLYSREEILAHEAVHAARAGLKSRDWDEFFAYMTSEKKWRRVLGPIVKRPWEVWPLLGFAGIGAVLPVGYLLCGIWMGIGFVRLMRAHRKLGRAARAILEEVKDAKKTRAILVRLTDEEIEALASGEKYGKKD